jgi:hypothetical protein
LWLLLFYRIKITKQHQINKYFVVINYEITGGKITQTEKNIGHVKTNQNYWWWIKLLILIIIIYRLLIFFMAQTAAVYIVISLLWMTADMIFQLWINKINTGLNEAQSQETKLSPLYQSSKQKQYKNYAHYLKCQHFSCSI